MKPPQLIRELLHVRKDALVLDSFAGSGTTARPCWNKTHTMEAIATSSFESMDYAEDISERVRRVITGSQETEQVEIYSQKLTAAT